MTVTAHVIPRGDIIAHGGTGEADECPCGPTSIPVKRMDGSVGWVITHHSLDGRELAEQPPAPVMCGHCGLSFGAYLTCHHCGRCRCGAQRFDVRDGIPAAHGCPLGVGEATS